jgi:hypothetical protein
MENATMAIANPPNTAAKSHLSVLIERIKEDERRSNSATKEADTLWNVKSITGSSSVAKAKVFLLKAITWESSL